MEVSWLYIQATTGGGGRGGVGKGIQIKVTGMLYSFRR